VKMVIVGLGRSPGTDSVTVLNPGADRLQMSINAKAGLFSGSFIHPITQKSTALQGALFQKNATAQGYFLSPTQSGAVSLTAD